jgi:hypothetical protein
MSNDGLIVTLEQSLRQARDTRSRLARRLNEIMREIDLLSKQTREIDSVINFMQSAIVRVTSSVVSASALSRVAGAGNSQIAETFNNIELTLTPSINITVLSDRFSNRTIPQAAAILLSESGEQLHVNEIYRRMVEGGYIFTSDNPTISIAGSLSRNPRFRKVAPNTFDLVLREVSSLSAS